MNHISADQVKLLVDKIISLKSNQIATEKSDYNKKQLTKIQGNFGNGQMVQLGYNGSDNMRVVIRTASKGGIERHIKLSSSSIIKLFCPYYRQWKRLHKNVSDRINNKEMEEAQNGMAEVSDAIVTIFPEVAEQYLLGDK